MEGTRVLLPGRRLRAPAIGAGLGESIRIALESLRANKLRTLLTMLGIIIGVWSVVSLISLGNGAQKTITDQVRSIGTNLLFVQRGKQRDNERGVATTAQNLGMDDVDALKRSIPELELVAPEFDGGGQVVAGTVNEAVQVFGVTADYAMVRNLTIGSGQFITEQMDRSGRSAAVIGSVLATDLFGNSVPLGQTIRLTSKPFTVVGVLKPGSGFDTFGSAVMVPLSTAHQKLFGGKEATSASYQVSGISLQVRSAKEIDLAQSKVELVLRRRHRLPDDGTQDDFTVRNQATLLSTFTTVTTTLTVFLGAISGISLLVGGIGVMNIMLVSVTERTSEIGLRKAVGAKRRDILRQFLVEALVISILGGLAGLALGYGTAMGIKAAFSQYITPIVTPSAVLLAVGFSAGVGLFFGIYPAHRASRLSPIDALRHE